jgi:tetratricopeptide (TPR) repeat protein
LLSEAKSLTEKNMAADAEPLARQYLDKHPDSATGHFLLGYILFAEIREHPGTNSQAARLAYTEKIKGAPGDKFTEEKARASLVEYTEGAKYATPSASDLRIVGLDYVLLGDYNDASKWFEKMLQWSSGDAEGWYYLGRTKYNQNRFEDRSARSKNLWNLSREM